LADWVDARGFQEMMTLMSIELLNLAQSSGMDTSATTLMLAQINPIVINLLVGAFLLISIVMILIVLIQRPQGGGLGGAFGAGGGGGGGGGGAGQTAFGTKTGDVLTGGTIAIFVLFIVFAVILNFVTRPPEAQPVQPTIASPVTTEPIPVDDSTIDESVVDPDAAPADDSAAEIIDDAIDAVDDAAEEINSTIDDSTDE
tara:strand:+ start:93796 stop:94395 length:600 start_codon:yes stop_codon:yes gene_type:complete